MELITSVQLAFIRFQKYQKSSNTAILNRKVEILQSFVFIDLAFTQEMHLLRNTEYEID